MLAYSGACNDSAEAHVHRQLELSKDTELWGYYRNISVMILILQ